MKNIFTSKEKLIQFKLNTLKILVFLSKNDKRFSTFKNERYIFEI